MDITGFNSEQKKRLGDNFKKTGWDNLRARNFERYLEVMPGNFRPQLRSKIRASQCIMDVGCGFGYALPGLLKRAREGAIVVGVDMDGGALEEAETHCKKELNKPKEFSIVKPGEGQEMTVLAEKQPRKVLMLYRADASSMLGTQKNKFDLILSVLASRYFEDKAAAIVRMLELLKDGGDAYLISSMNDMLLLEKEPALPLLYEAQDRIYTKKSSTTKAVISELLRTKGMPYRFLGAYDFIREYLKGVRVERKDMPPDHEVLKIHKTGRLSLKKNPLLYRSFLIGAYQYNKTLSIYVKK